MRIACKFQNFLLLWDDSGKVEPFFTTTEEPRFGYCQVKNDEVAERLAKEHNFEVIPLHEFVHHIVERSGLGKLGSNPPAGEWEQILGGDLK